MATITVSPTFFNQSISKQRPLWQTLTVCALLLSAPFLLAVLSGSIDEVIASPLLRPLLLPPVIISYILLIAPLMVRGEAEMVRRMRPVVLVDDEEYAQLVAESTRTQPGGEIAAVMVGALFGLFLSRNWQVDGAAWLSPYMTIGQSLMFALLAWTIYDSLASTRLLQALHSRPLFIDLLDITPFEPVGRQSLLSALVFLGGILISALLGLQLDDFRFWRTWLVYVPLAGVVVVLFFLSMRHTHRVLTAAKERELEMITHRLRKVNTRFRQELADGESSGETAALLGGLLAYERRIQAAPTWPYNPSMLQTLMFSVLLPLAARALTWLLFER